MNEMLSTNYNGLRKQDFSSEFEHAWSRFVTHRYENGDSNTDSDWVDQTLNFLVKIHTNEAHVPS